jgi:predicted dehydrogenase
MTSLGVALIGTGFMGKCHAMAWSHVRPVFGDVPEIRLEILCDVDPELIRKRAAEYGFVRPETDWRKLVDDPRIDIVSITAPNNVHREMAVAFLAAGKHVWCEKPMALTLEEAEAMAAAAAKAKGRTLLGYNYIKNPAVLHAKHLIEAGAIGEIVHFRGQVDEDYLASPDVPWSKRARIDLWGLGTLGDITCHLVSFAHLLIGDIASVSADMETVVRERPVPGTTEMRAVENEDIAHAIVRFRSGISGVLTSEGPDATRGFRTILTGPAHSPYAQFTPVAGHQLGFNELKVIEAKHLLDCIADGREAFVNFAEGLKIERVIHGMARSARERRWVEVN